jgi:hypothetical protein
MRRLGIAIFGLFIVLTQQVVPIAFGFGFESVPQFVSYVLITGGGILIVFASVDPSRFDSDLRWNYVAGAGLALVGAGVMITGALSFGIGEELIDRIAAGGQIVGALIIVWFGWQVGFDTRHANLDWADSAK